MLLYFCLRQSEAYCELWAEIAGKQIRLLYIPSEMEIWAYK